MNLSDLPAAVKKTYESVIPPVFETAVVIAAVIYLIGFHTFATQIQLLMESNNLLPNATIQEVLKFYGLNTLIPIAVLFMVLAIAHGMSRFVRMSGRLLPGFLIPNITLLLVTSVPKHVLLILWSYFPPSSDINQINQSLEEDVHKARFRNDAASPLKGLGFRYDRMHRYTDRIDFVKGVIFWLLIVWLSLPYLLELPARPTSRLIYALLVAALFILVFAKKRVRAYREYYGAKIDAFLDLKELEFAERPTVADDIKRTRSWVLDNLMESAEKNGPWSFRLWIIERQPDYNWLLKAAKSYLRDLYIITSWPFVTAAKQVKRLLRRRDAA